MNIKRIIGGNLESNGYIIYNKEGMGCYVIDPGYNPDKYIKFIHEKGLNPLGILLTHHHYDHVGGVAKIRSTFECPVMLHRGDLDMYREPVDHVLEDQEVLMLEGEEIRVIHTPGHTEGGVCYYSEKNKLAFTGDTIFNVDLGRTDMKDGNEAKMIETVKNILDKWSNEITIYPGHGDSCNMKFVRKYNTEFLDIMSNKGR